MFNQKSFNEFQNGFFEALYYVYFNEDNDISSDVELDEQTNQYLYGYCLVWWHKCGYYVEKLIDDGTTINGLGNIDNQAGQALFMTMYNAGSGFNDIDWKDIKYVDIFSKVADTFGEIQFHMGDDKKVYCY